jgi:phenylpyruvate tautomerase PptA (4-oxalocrotonate tautomerase family)
MPLWNIYHPVNSYTEQEKKEFAERITSFYEGRGLPRFYVVTLFHEVDQGSFYIGGEPVNSGVRIAIEHIARQAGDQANQERVRQLIADVIEPFVTAKGLHWEFHVDYTPKDVWIIDGFVPPPADSDAEKQWAKENRPSPY